MSLDPITLESYRPLSIHRQDHLGTTRCLQPRLFVAGELLSAGGCMRMKHIRHPRAEGVHRRKYFCSLRILLKYGHPPPRFIHQGTTDQQRLICTTKYPHSKKIDHSRIFRAPVSVTLPVDGARTP